MRTTIVWHVLWEHWKLVGWLVAFLKAPCDVKILLVERIKVNINTKSRPIIGTDHSGAWEMDDVAVPAHETHLEPQDGRVTTLVGKDEFDGVAVRHPYKPLAKDVLAYFVNGVVAGEAFAEVGVQSSFITASATSTKANRMEGCFRI